MKVWKISRLDRQRRTGNSIRYQGTAFICPLRLCLLTRHWCSEAAGSTICLYMAVGNNWNGSAWRTPHLFSFVFQGCIRLLNVTDDLFLLLFPRHRFQPLLSKLSASIPFRSRDWWCSLKVMFSIAMVACGSRSKPKSGGLHLSLTFSLQNQSSILNSETKQASPPTPLRSLSWIGSTMVMFFYPRT